MDLQVFVNGMIFVEPFFLMSGFLVSIMLMRHLDQSKGSFNVLHFYFHRYIRHYLHINRYFNIFRFLNPQ